MQATDSSSEDAFWSANFKSDEVTWSVFQKGLANYLGVSLSDNATSVRLRAVRLMLSEMEAMMQLPAGIDPCQEALVAALARCEHLTTVRRATFQRLLLCFGPFQPGQEFLANMEQLLRVPYFHGAKSKDGADRMLNGFSRGDCSLLRFSLTKPGLYVRSARTGKTVTHTYVPYLPATHRFVFGNKEIQASELQLSGPSSSYLGKLALFLSEAQLEVRSAERQATLAKQLSTQQLAAVRACPASLANLCCRCMLTNIADFDADSLQYIPETISRVILKYCFDNPRSINNQSLFPFLMPDIKSLSLRSANIAFEKIARSCPNLEELDLSECFLLTQPEFETIVSKVRGLKKLRLKGCQWLKQSCASLFSKYCKNLKVLDIRGCPVSEFLHVDELPRLTWLGLSFVTNFSSLQQLTYLEVEDPPRFYGALRSWIPASLRTFKLIDGQPFDAEHLLSLLNQARKLEELQVPLSVTPIPPELLGKIVSAVHPALRSLNLGNGSLDPQLPAVIYKCTQLEELCVRSSSLDALALKPHARLQGVRIRGPGQIQAAAFATMLSECPCLRWLSVQQYTIPGEVAITHRTLEQLGLGNVTSAGLTFTDLPSLNLLPISFIRGVKSLKMINLPLLASVQLDCRDLQEVHLENCQNLADQQVTGGPRLKFTVRNCPKLPTRVGIEVLK